MFKVVAKNFSFVFTDVGVGYDPAKIKPTESKSRAQMQLSWDPVACHLYHWIRKPTDGLKTRIIIGWFFLLAPLTIYFHSLKRVRALSRMRGELS